MAPEIAELVARLMAAEGPDRELDAEVGVAAGHYVRTRLPQAPGEPHFRLAGPGHQPPFVLLDRWKWTASGSGCYDMAPYTALLDTALTMLPPDVIFWSVSRSGPGARTYAEVVRRTAPNSRGEGANPAIAMCVAVLTSRN